MAGDSEVAEKFAEHLQQFHTLPVLFVGSGLSRRYMGLPDWRGLLRHFAESIGRPLAYYEGKTTNKLPGVASLIAEDLYERWWADDTYVDSRQHFSDIIANYADPLKIEISKYLAEFSPVKLEGALRNEFDALSRTNAHAIITTNWDRLLEDRFPSYESFSGQEAVLFSETQGIGEIYKIHGSMDDPRSLVLTHEDYVTFENRNPYLLAKTMTFFVENPVVFLGYSLTDEHIARLLSKLLDCISPENVDKLNNRLVFVRRVNDSNPVGYRMAPLLIDGHQLNVVECVLDDFGLIYEAMAALPRRFPVKMLRQLKQEIYELAYTETPSSRIQVVDIDDDTRLQDIDVVVGVGTRAALASKGYVGFSRRDLVLAMLRDELDHPAQELFEHVIPRVFRQAQYAPVLYPLFLDARAGGSEAERQAELPPRAAAIAARPTLTPYSGYQEVEGRPFHEIASSDPSFVLSAGLACTFELPEDIEALKTFLLGQFEDEGRSPDTFVYKLACKYDQLVYGPKLDEVSRPS